MIRIAAFLLLSCLALPALAAESLPAGFAPGSVWLSKSRPLAGETVEIFAVVYDASTTSIAGSVSFLIDGESVGEAPFTLDPGETEIRSARWTATAGTHALSARLEGPDAGLLSMTAGTSTIVVADPPPPPEPEEEEPSVPSALIQDPVLASALAPALAAAEGIRLAGEALLAEYAQERTASTTPDGEVLGTSTEESSSEPSVAARAARTILPAFSSPALFYPLALLLLLALLWLVARRLRNPRGKRRR